MSNKIGEFGGDDEIVTDEQKANEGQVKRSEAGRKGRAKGRNFELKVRKALEKKGWVMAKWTNNVEFSEDFPHGTLVPAKRKYNPFTKFASFGNGFPDFIAYRIKQDNYYEVIGVEVKVRGYLDKEEKIKCGWLIKNKIFNVILIAKNGKKRGEIIYEEFNPDKNNSHREVQISN